MKKIDKLVLKSFLGPLVMTLLVVVFILLTKQMLYYFDDIIGKDLGWKVLGQFLVYFTILMMPAAMPLAILLASLITFGNLGEHFELTAIKASGVSLPRVLQPIFFFILLLTGIAFYINNYVVPEAALQAYALLYDIRQKKPALDIREGIFYNGIPNISIRVNRKFPDDDAALKDIMLYDHRGKDGNTEVLLADSGRMSTLLGDRFMKLEFFSGYQYAESKDLIPGMSSGKAGKSPTHSRRKFSKAEMILDLSTFNFSRTDTRLFESDRLVRNMKELEYDIDSIKRSIAKQRSAHAVNHAAHFIYFNKDYLAGTRTPSKSKLYEDLFTSRPSRQTLQTTTDFVRQIKSRIENTNASIGKSQTDLRVYEVQWHRIPANAFACIVMFLIGAPLGAIIKKGGLGVPFLVSIFFFVVYTLLGMQGEKLAKHDFFPASTGVWISNFLLLIVGFIFLKSARNDARLFERDFYKGAVLKIKRWFLKVSGL